MAIRRVSLVLFVTLTLAAAVPGIAVAGDCGLTRCGAGVEENGKCKTYADFSCDEVCNDNGCDGGDSVGGEFSCSGVGPWKVCQCNSCLEAEAFSYPFGWSQGAVAEGSSSSSAASCSQPRES